MKNYSHFLLIKAKGFVRENKSQINILYLFGLFLIYLETFTTDYKDTKDYILKFGLFIIGNIPLLYYIIHRLLRIYNINGPQSNLDEEKVNIIIGIDDPVLTVDEEDIPIYHVKEFTDKEKERFEFATGEQLKLIAGLINYIIFRDSTWAGREFGENKSSEMEALSKKIKRNSNHIDKNKAAILLVKNTQGIIVGFTHILVINKDCWEDYIEGEISDINFSARHICNEDEEGYAILLFSIGYLEIQQLQSFIKKLGQEYSPEIQEAISLLQRIEPENEINYAHIILKAVRYHVNELIKRHFIKSDKVRFLVQVGEDRLEKILKSKTFKVINKLSKDNCTLLKTKMKIDRV